MADKIKFVVVALILVGAVGAFYYFGDASLLLRVLGLLAATGVAAAVYFQTGSGQQAWAFFGEAKTEVRKVVWPTRKETVQTTLAVFAFVVVLATFMWIIDLFLTWVVRLLMGQGG